MMGGDAQRVLRNSHQQQHTVYTILCNIPHICICGRQQQGCKQGKFKLLLSQMSKLNDFGNTI